jgi:hypothetical protein
VSSTEAGHDLVQQRPKEPRASALNLPKGFQEATPQWSSSRALELLCLRALELPRVSQLETALTQRDSRPHPQTCRHLVSTVEAEHGKMTTF